MNIFKKLWAKTLEVYELYTWTFVVVMFLNQLLFFGLCLNPICLIAAMPHVLLITVILGTLINKFSPKTEEDITDFNKNNNVQHQKNSLDNEENLEINTNLQKKTATIKEVSDSQEVPKIKKDRTDFNTNSYGKYPKNISADLEINDSPKKIIASTTSPETVKEIYDRSASTKLTSKVDRSNHLTEDQVSIINGLIQDAIIYDSNIESPNKYSNNTDESYEDKLTHRKNISTKFRHSMKLKFNDNKNR